VGLTACRAANRPATAPLVPAADAPAATAAAAATATTTTLAAPGSVAPPTARPQPSVTAARAATTPVAPSTTIVAPVSGHALGGRPLAGRVVAVDPGHNGGNAARPSVIDQLVWNGRSLEACDTTGTETPGGYTESLFNFEVAADLAADLRAEGATVVTSRPDNNGVGPCITERAAFANAARADAAVSIHADGGPAGGRGFAVLEPVSDGVNAGIIASSARLAVDVRDAFETGTGMPTSTYDGVDGTQARDDLGGLNLSTVPKVLVECANMRNATDAALLTTAGWQQQAAAALARGITAFLG
jgi:N-acetylmuramoyl-L-alanine amidase